MPDIEKKAEVQKDIVPQPNHEKKTVIKIVCMYCKKDMGEKDGEGMEGISHSICEDCIKEAEKEFGVS
jgi:hypothetical protein